MASASTASRRCGRIVNSSAPLGSVTTVGVVRPRLISAAISGVAGGDRARRPRRPSRAGRPRADIRIRRGGRRPSARAISSTRSRWREHLRAADLDLAPGRLGNVERLAQVVDDVLGADRLGLGLEPVGRRQHRQALDDPAQQLVGLAARPDHHRGAEVGERRALGGERRGDLVARRRDASRSTRRRARRGRSAARRRPPRAARAKRAAAARSIAG